MSPDKPATVARYLESLEPERRAAIKKIRTLVKKHLPKGYVETMAWGMIAWELPLSTYPKTYNGKALCYAALAAQKNYNTLYLTGAYMDQGQVKRLRQAFEAAGKKFDMGKSCLHFKRADDLALDAVGEAIASTPPAAFISGYEASRNGR